MKRALLTQRAVHEEELAQLRAHHSEETAKLKKETRQLQNTALDSLRAAHESELNQLRAHHGEEIAKLQREGRVRRTRGTLDKGSGIHKRNFASKDQSLGDPSVREP